MSISNIITDLCAIRQKMKKKKKRKHFSRYCLQCFTSERVLIEHKETCLKINGKQNLNLRVFQLNLEALSNS